jgi:hypothetical protein
VDSAGNLMLFEKSAYFLNGFMGITVHVLTGDEDFHVDPVFCNSWPVLIEGSQRNMDKNSVLDSGFETFLRSGYGIILIAGHGTVLSSVRGTVLASGHGSISFTLCFP